MKVALKIIVPIAIILLAFAGFKLLKSLKPKPESREPRPAIPVLNVINISAEDHVPPVITYGTVKSYFETDLTPQVSGKITYVSPKFRVGETVDAEHLLVKIDPTDYQAALATEQANLSVAERTFAEEEIRAQQAASDWKASGRELSKASDFVLRKPQLAAAKASIESAKATIAKAQADLSRTEVRAPFPAIITVRNASPGNLASPQASLGNLVATDKSEIRLPLTASQSARVKVPSEVVLTSPLQPDTSWQASLVRMDPTVDQQNQVVYAVAEIAEPYADGKPPLPVGIFANASIQAEPILNSYRIPEAAFVGDHYFWVLDEDDELQRMEGKAIHTFERNIYVRLEDGGKSELRIVTRPLSNFKPDMQAKAAEKKSTEE